jgi:porphobilinogen synthase
LFVAIDVCLCSYTSTGQCGIVNAEGDHLENAATVEELARAATAFAQAGADCVAPSDMMDGRVAAIRESLDKNNLHKTLIMSYAAKFNSKYYGPFRAAADSAPKGEIKLKDRSTYQLDTANPNDSFASAMRDAEEGADILMVKPGLPYLDVLSTLSAQIAKPWAAYEVSGEFASVELMAAADLMNGPAAHLEAWTSLFRAGADMVITYGARRAREWIRDFEEAF